MLLKFKYIKPNLFIIKYTKQINFLNSLVKDNQNKNIEVIDVQSNRETICIYFLKN